MLDDIARQINLLTQGLTKLAEEQKQQPEEEIEKKEIEELEEKEADVCIININTASKEELQKLTGVGLVIAQRIIDDRPFSSVYDLKKVSGIGETTLQKIIEQGCAYVEGDTGPSSSSDSDSVSVSGGNEGSSSSSSTQPQPQISLSYPEDNPVDREIEVTLSTANIKNTTYDVKISILKISEENEQKRTLSEIYDGEKYSSSYNYLIKVFSGTSFSGKFKLKIKDEYKDFRGQTDIAAKIRDSNGKINLEFKGKINITNPEQETPILEGDEEEGETIDVEEATTTPPSYPKILISEVQIEGDNIDNDFIELYNPNDSDADISGYKLRKRTSGGTESSICILPSGSIIAGKGYYLWASSKDENYPSLINADASTTQTLASNNSIALLTSDETIISVLAWGSSTTPFVETSPFPENPGKNQSLGRIWDEETGEFKNTGDNSADFEFQPPTPKNQNRSFPPAKLEVSPEVLEFSIDSPSKYLSITNSGEQGLNWQAVIQYATPPVDGWLNIFPDSGQLSASETKRIEVSQYLASFPEGEYQAKIIVDADQIEGSPKEIEVLLKATDDTPPIVYFNPLFSIQRESIFTLSWQGEDVIPVTPIQDGVSFVSPSGIDGFLLVYTSTSVLDGVAAGLNGLQYFDFKLNQWKSWLEDKILFVRDTFLKLLAKDKWTYFFRIKAEDKAGNQSEEWIESDAVKINLPKPILKVEPQSLEFGGIEFGSNPELETFIISNIGDTPLEWEIEIYPEVSWLSLNPVFGQLVSKNDEDISVSVDISDLSFGQYVIDLLISSNGGSKQIEAVLELEKDNVLPANADLVLADLTSESNFYTQNRIVKAAIANDQDASFWLLSENQVKPEVDSSNWQTAKPSTFTLSEGDGLKTVYLWTKDKAGNISELGNSASIILDTTPPIAKAGEDKIVEINQPITFDASGSSDNTEITSFKWDIDDGDGLSWEEPDLVGETLVFTGYSQIGNYRVTLQVSDVVGRISADTFLVSVILPQLTLEVVINEIAWMGTKTNPADEWIELCNNTTSEIDLVDWTLTWTHGPTTHSHAFSTSTGNTTISAQGFFLLERSDDKPTDIPGDQFFKGGLDNDGEKLELRNTFGNLIDLVDCSFGWFAGKASPDYISMERIDLTTSGNISSNWANNNLITRNGYDAGSPPNRINGTPKSENSVAKSETQISSLPFDEGFDEIALTFYGSPYVVQWTPYVPTSKTLIIEPGVVMKFKDIYSGMTIDGTLKAIGTENKKIVFTSYKDKEYGGSGGAAGDWKQIYFSPESSNSELNNVIVRYGGAYPDAMFPCYYKAAAIFVDEQSSIILKNSIIEDNRIKGVYLIDSSSVIDDVYFRNHQVGCYPDSHDGTGLHVSGGSPVVKNSFFQDNVTGIEIWSAVTPEIKNNIFGKNERPIYVQSSSPIFGSNQAVDNNLNGILISGSIAEDSVWLASLPYIINGDLNILEDVILTLEPEVVIKLRDVNSIITINGALKAIGMEDEKIIFTSYEDEEYGGGGNGYWKALYFYSSGSILENVTVKYGGGSYGAWGFPKQNFGAITLHSENIEITVKNSILEKNKYAVVIFNNSDCPSVERVIAKFKSENTIFRDNKDNVYPPGCSS